MKKEFGIRFGKKRPMTTKNLTGIRKG